MKFVHLSDLHLGKRVSEFSMLEEQEYILRQILDIIRREKPEGVLIAGDVYDKPVPSGEAVTLLDWFLTELSGLSQVFLICGNHDSPERLAFGGRLMLHSGIHTAPLYSGRVEPILLQDAHGQAAVYLLPFLKPAHVRRFFPDSDTSSYTAALETAIGAMEINPEIRNILVTHQFVTGAARCDSEELSVGGADNVDASVFEPFDYVALGHLHGPQRVGRETLRYCGSPLKYSFSEARQEKSVTVAELGEKGCVSVRTLPLIPRRELRELRGSYEELTLRSFYQDTAYQEDYVHLILTDEEDIPDGAARLHTIYHNLMKLSYDNRRTRAGLLGEGPEEEARKSPMELLEEFYQGQNGQPMSEEQRRFVQGLLKEEE